MENVKEFLLDCKKFGIKDSKEGCLSLFERVQDSHNSIRKLLNGHTLQISIEFENKNRPISDEEFKPIIQRLKEYLPRINEDLRDCYGRNISDLKMPTMRIFDYNHKFVNSSTFISNNMQRYCTTQDQKKCINKCLSELGELWKRHETKSGEITTELSTQAVDFLRLGSFGPDNASCFKYDGGSSDTRYLLGELEDTYVVKFYQNNKIIARMLGALTSKSVMNFFNLYMDKGVAEGNLTESLKTVYTNIFDVNEDDINVFRNKFFANDIYMNEAFSPISFTTKKILDKQTI